MVKLIKVTRSKAMSFKEILFQLFGTAYVVYQGRRKSGPWCEQAYFNHIFGCNLVQESYVI
jgi:hypothetical protein